MIITPDADAKRWSSRKNFWLSLAFIVIVFGLLVVHALYKKEQERAQTFKRIAALEIILARYRPSPELLERSPKYPCVWVVLDRQQPDKNNPYGTWEVRCEVPSKLSSGTRTVVAEWTVNSFLADSPDAGAQKLFIRNPQ